jgi:hypothetical protein
MEYKLSTEADTEYEPVTGEEITGLTAGTYQVRYAAKTGFNAGAAAVVVVPEGLRVVSISTITGVEAPIRNEAPIITVEETAQYTGSVSWSPEIIDGKFAAETVYTAIIALSPKEGYTLTGVAADFFEVTGATTSNQLDGVNITAVFPATEAVPAMIGDVTISGVPKYHETLTADISGLTNVGTPSYQWYREGDGTPLAEIEGATGVSYVLSEADVHQYITVKVIADGFEGTGTATSSVKYIEKGDPSAPTEGPTLSEKGVNYIYLVLDSRYEYLRKGDDRWFTSATFMGLEADTEYSFVIRFKETDYQNASPESPVTIIRTSGILAKAAKPIWDGYVLRWEDIENEDGYAVRLYKDGILDGSSPASANAEFYDFSYRMKNTAGSYTATVTGISNQPGCNGPESDPSDVYTITAITAEVGTIATVTGSAIINMGQTITGLAADDIVVNKNGTALTYLTDYTLSDLGTTSVGITFTAAAALNSESVITIAISKSGYIFNGGFDLPVVNNIKSNNARLSTIRIKGADVYYGEEPTPTAPTASAGAGVLLTSTQAADISNTGDCITSFIPFDSGATITKVAKVQYPNFAEFDSAPDYDNGPLQNYDIIIIKVTAADGSVLYYSIIISVMPD